MNSQHSPERLLEALAQIDAWVNEAPVPASLLTNDAFMTVSVGVMNRALFLLTRVAALAPTEHSARSGLSKHRAIVVGHLVRIAKLYEGALAHIAECRLELAAIFSRLIVETAFRLEYLIRSPARAKSIRSFILASYKPEREILEDLREKAHSRKLEPIERRMVRKISARLRGDRVSRRTLAQNRIWNVDGKDFRRLLADLDLEPIYAYAFASASHHVHGDWYEISQYHIRKHGRRYTPVLAFHKPDPRLSCSLTAISLNALINYLTWSGVDPDKVVLPVAEHLRQYNRLLDSAHEGHLGT